VARTFTFLRGADSACDMFGACGTCAYKQINNNNKIINEYHYDKNVTLTNKNIKIKYSKNNGTINTCVKAV
jgi:hypothetical protein